MERRRRESGGGDPLPKVVILVCGGHYEDRNGSHAKCNKRFGRCGIFGPGVLELDCPKCGARNRYRFERHLAKHTVR